MMMIIMIIIIITIMKFILPLKVGDLEIKSKEGLL